MTGVQEPRLDDGKSRITFIARRIALFLPLIVAGAFPGVGTLIAAAIVVISLVAFRDSRGPTLARTEPLRAVAIGVTCGIVIALVIGLLLDQLLASLVGAPPDLSAFNAVRGNTTEYLKLLALGMLYGAIVEELIFRGFVVGWGGALFGRSAELPLMVLSAAVFGITHLYQGVTGMVTTGLIGLGYGAAFLLGRRNLLAAIAAHMTVNAIGATQLYLGL